MERLTRRARAAAGVLAFDEVIAAMTEDAFRVAADIPIYERDGAPQLERSLADRHRRARAGCGAVGSSGRFCRCDIRNRRSSGIWSLDCSAIFPDADVRVREHRLTSRRHPARFATDHVWSARHSPSRALQPTPRIRRSGRWFDSIDRFRSHFFLWPIPATPQHRPMLSTHRCRHTAT